MVGTIVMFVPKDDKVFPYNLNGAKELPAIIIQDFGGYQNLGVFTPFDGVKTAWSIPEGKEDYNQGYWYKNPCNCIEIIGTTNTGVASSSCDPKFLIEPNTETATRVVQVDKTKYPIQKNKKPNKK